MYDIKFRALVFAEFDIYIGGRFNARASLNVARPRENPHTRFSKNAIALMCTWAALSSRSGRVSVLFALQLIVSGSEIRTLRVFSFSFLIFFNSFNFLILSSFKSAPYSNTNIRFKSVNTRRGICNAFHAGR